MNGEDISITTIYARICEVLTVLYVAGYTGIQVRAVVALHYGARPDARGFILIRCAAVALFLMLFFYAATRWRERAGFWVLTMTLAFAVQLLSSGIMLWMQLRGQLLPPAWAELAESLAGPVSNVFLWSLFIYSLAMTGGGRYTGEASGQGEGASELPDGGQVINLRLNWLTTLLTVLLVLGVPIAVYYSVHGLIAWDFAGQLQTLTETWGGAISLVLCVGYVMAYRRGGVGILKYLAFVFAVGALYSSGQMMVASPYLGRLLEEWGVRLVAYGVISLLPALQVYFWLRAGLASGASGMEDSG